MASFDGKVTLITGASAGIGAATAVLFARRGASLVLTARRLEKLEQTARLCREAGCADDQVHVVAADVTVEGDVVRLIESSIQKFGRLDILVNNAGAMTVCLPHMLSVAEVDKMYEMNVRSVVHITQLALPHLIQSQGSITNISSIAGIRPHTGAMAYSMSKAAVDNFTRSLAVELAPQGVRVNMVNPSFVNTDIFQSFLTEKTYPMYMAEMASTHPMGRLATTDEVAHTIAFLASDDATYVTGVSVPMDGGKLHTMMTAKEKLPTARRQGAPLGAGHFASNMQGKSWKQGGIGAPLGRKK